MRAHVPAQTSFFSKVMFENVTSGPFRSTTLYQFTGHEHDGATGLDYHGARYYDSAIARYLAVDPLAGKYASWSAYNYVLGNPISLIDPMGREPIDDKVRKTNPNQGANHPESAHGRGVARAADTEPVWMKPLYAPIEAEPARDKLGGIIHAPTASDWSESPIIAFRDFVNSSVYELFGFGAADDLSYGYISGEVSGAETLEGGAYFLFGAGPGGRNRVSAGGGVYCLRNSSNQILRTGRTNNLARRASEHARDPLLRDYTFEPMYKTNSYLEQRGIEQIVHVKFQPPLNRVNPISPKNPRLQEYLNAAKTFIEP